MLPHLKIRRSLALASAVMALTVPALALAAPSAASIQRADIKLPIQNYIGAFGGPAGVKALINTFVGYVAADPHINYYFAHTNIKALKYNLTQQVCEIVGGPCTYTGPTMTAAHKNLQVTTAAFNYLAQDMIKAMDKRGIAKPAQNYLLEQVFLGCFLVGSSRVDLQACKLEYSIVSPK